MADPQQIHIIGISDDGLEGLTSRARELIQQAQVLIGSAKALSSVPESAADRVEFSGDLGAIVDQIQARDGQRMVLLALGDPLFYGTARYLCEQLGKERFDVLPHVSTMQLAFARVKESWDEAYLTNLANQDLSRVIEKIHVAEKVGLFTTDEITPNVLAEALLDRRIDGFTAYVCENLGAPDEKVTHGELSDIVRGTFSGLNVVVLVRKPEVPDRPLRMQGRRLFGNPDEMFLQSKPKRGLLTPAEVRSIALAELDLGPSSLVWDVGAGSGAVAIEAAQIASEGRVYAIEMDPEDCELIKENAAQFGVQNLVAVLGKAPEAWAELEAPDAIFVGGTGRQISCIVEQAFQQLRPGGRLLANVGSVENLASIRELLHRQAGDANTWMINVSRGVYQLERVRFESLNPTFLIGAVKPEEAARG